MAVVEYGKVAVDVSKGIYDFWGLGSPSTSLANAAVGSLYRQLDGGSGSMIWQRTTSAWESLQTSAFNQAFADGRYARLAFPNTMTDAVPFTFNNATSNWLLWSANGVAAPAFTTRSAGTKLVLFPGISGSTVDYALGIESGTLWFSAPATSSQFKWYASTASVMTLSGVGQLTLSDRLLFSNVTTGSWYDILIQQAPTQNSGIALASSSVAGGIGQAFSSGNVFITYNAAPVTKGVDSWAQSLSSLASTKVDISNAGIALYTAVAGKATASNATFWGTTTITLESVGGNIKGIGQLRMGSQAGSNGLAGDVIAARSTTAGAIYFGNSTASYLYWDGSNYFLGAASGYLDYASGGMRANYFYINSGTASGSQIDGSISTYGSINIVGINSGYAGIKFSSLNTNFMFSGLDAVAGGMYHNVSGWMWYFSDGADLVNYTTLWHRQIYLHLSCRTSQTSGGILLTTSALTLKGYLYWDANGFGLLNSAGGWAVQTTSGGGTLFGDWFVNDNTNTTRRVCKIIQSTSAPTTETAPEGTIWIKY